MSSAIVMDIDPGIDCSGFAIYEVPARGAMGPPGELLRVVGSWESTTDRPLHHRVAELVEGFQNTLASFAEKPQIIWIEKPKDGVGVYGRNAAVGAGAMIHKLGLTYLAAGAFLAIGTAGGLKTKIFQPDGTDVEVKLQLARHHIRVAGLEEPRGKKRIRKWNKDELAAVYAGGSHLLESWAILFGGARE